MIAGTEDAVTTPADAQFIVEQVTGAQYAEFAAAHLSNVEIGAPFSDRVVEFLLR